MKKIAKPALLLVGAAVLAACNSPEYYETEPVQVQTSGGVVTCQLYTKGLVAWDRSVGRPASMSVEVADQVCKAEGVKLQNGTAG